MSTLRNGILLAVSLVVFGNIFPGCSETTSDRTPRHLVLITLDTTRSDHLSCYGYSQQTTPHIDRLAERGVLFQQAYSAAPITLPSHATILTGTYPFYHGARDNGIYKVGDANVTLAEILRENGFATGAVVAAMVLEPAYGLDQGFDYYSADIRDSSNPGGQMPERPANKVTDNALAWLRQNQASRVFLWAHYFDPHRPWQSPREYAARFASSAYDAEIAFMDHEVGRLLEGMDELGLLDETLVVVVGDHGEALGGHGEMTHGLFVYDETVKVPWIMAGPSIPRRAAVDDVVRTVDLVPTVLDLLGLAPPPYTQGTDLAERIRGGEPLSLDAYFETYLPQTSFGLSWLEGIRRDDPPFKYIDAPQPELYDLAADPQETTNLAAARPELLARFAGILRALHEGGEPVGSAPLSSAITPSAEARRQLQALGYVAGPPVSAARRGPDPKSIAQYMKLAAMGEAKLNAGRGDEALALFEQFVERLPNKGYASQEVATSLAVFAERLAQAGRWQESKRYILEAIRFFKTAAAASPDNAEIHYNLGLAYKSMGKTDLFIQHLELCLTLRPDFTRALYALGRYRFDRRAFDQAFTYLDRLVQLSRPEAGVRNQQVLDALMLSGACLLELGRSEEGMQRLERCLKLWPDWLEPHYFLGQAAYDRGAMDKARSHLRRYLKQPGENPAWQDRARRLLHRIESR